LAGAPLEKGNGEVELGPESFDALLGSDAARTRLTIERLL